MTPRMLLAAAERWAEREKQRRDEEDQRAGTVAAAVFIAGGVKLENGRAKKWTPRDFFPSLPAPAEPTEEEMAATHAAAMTLWAGMFTKREETHAA